jgi:diguanylate cyclase (GGDEF)-like protein
MSVPRTWAALLAAIVAVCAAALIAMSTHPAWALIPGVIAVACASSLYARTACAPGRSGEAGGIEAGAVASAIDSILEGETPDVSTLDPRLASALNDVAGRMESLNVELAEMSPSDELTSLAKEGVFNNVLWREFNRAQRYNEPMSLVMLEVERIEEIAGERGQKEKDAILKRVASVILQMVRETDLAARDGEDRFAVIMPQTAEKGALEFSQRLSKSIEEGGAGADGGEAAVTVAMGAASIPGEGVKTAPDLVTKASAALGRARSAGRTPL